MSDFLGTLHHEFTFTVEEGIDALYDLIWHIESYEQVRVGGGLMRSAARHRKQRHRQPALLAAVPAGACLASCSHPVRECVALCC